MEFIKKQDIKEIIKVGLSTGADFCEVFLEDTTKNSIELSSNKISKAETKNIHGASVRLLKGSKETFGYINDWDVAALMHLASELSSSIKDKVKTKVKVFSRQEKRNIIVPEILPHRVKNSKKIKIIKKLNEAVRNYSTEVSQAIITLIDSEQNILVANSLGTFVKDVRSNVRMGINCIAGKDQNMQTISDSIGGNQGYELFNNYDIESFGINVAESAVKMAHADEMVGGKMTVVINNAFGGVILHEACVHSLEATSVAKGASVFCGKLGQKIASEKVNAIDDGTRLNQWGSLNYDDEGNPTQKNILIENGILKSYLVDYRNSRIMNHPITGSGRRQDYKYSPTSRMTNTFFAPGNDSVEDIIKNTKFGLYAKRMGGGSVNPSTGEFNFAVNEGYMIEDGKITRPVRGATLVGSGAEVLMNIDMISDNLAFGHGVCGSASGSVPTDVGQPTIRVQNITVGGRGK